jgi:hypothetical protein
VASLLCYCNNYGHKSLIVLSWCSKTFFFVAINVQNKLECLFLPITAWYNICMQGQEPALEGIA